MKFRHSVLLCSLFSLQEFAEGFRLSLHGNVGRSSNLRRRDSLFGTTSLADSSDIQYNTNLSLNGQNYQVSIDTGSSDLWVAGTVNNAQDTGKTSSVTYVGGEVQGVVKTAQLEFAGFSINNQAYLEVPPSQNGIGGSGLIGLGPSAGSNIRATMGTSAGDPALDRIFQSNMSTPNFLTILLSRSDDPGEKYPGELTVGETVPGFEAIANQPKISVTQVPNSFRSGQHWQVQLDPNGIIGSDGKAIPVQSTVAGASQAIVVFDSGYSLPQVPRSVSDAIYADIPGAKFENISGIGEIYTLPCDQEVNVTFMFAGVKYPIHPLDANMNGSDLLVTDSAGGEICFGSLQPITFDQPTPLFDMIMGMAFLRNAYISVNFGDFVEGSTNTASPYVQLLSLTNDSAAAHQDFVKVRLGGTTENNSPMSSNIKKIIVIAGAAGLGILALLIGLCFCCSRSRKTTTTGGVMGFGGRTYQPLHEPAPNAAYETHALPNLSYNGGQHSQPPAYGSQQQYQTAWDHHY